VLSVSFEPLVITVLRIIKKQGNCQHINIEILANGNYRILTWKQLEQRFSTCGSWPTSGPRRNFWRAYAWCYWNWVRVI